MKYRRLVFVVGIIGVAFVGFVFRDTLIKSTSAVGGNFVGIQFSEEGGDESGNPGFYGDPQYTPFSDGATPWAADNNAFDPNYARVYIGDGFFPGVATQDFRIGVQTIDGNNHGPGCDEQSTSVAWTPWASDGGGSSGWQSDTNVYDPNCGRLFVETRTMPQDKAVTDARLGVAVSNRNGCRTSNPPADKWTPWSSQGGGWSGFSFSAPNDFDCISVSLEARVVHYGSIIVKTAARGGNPPPPATWVIRAAATNGIVAQQSSPVVMAQYDNLPQGLYALDTNYLPTTPISYQGRSYILDTVNDNGCGVGNAICPGTTASLGTHDDSCTLSGNYNPHTACVNNACRVVTGCGPSDCSACQDPRGDHEPPPPRETLAPWTISRALAEDGDGDFHNVCSGTFCEAVPGVGVDACFSDIDCGGQPPDLGGGGTPPPPARLTFTINYVVSGGQPPAGGPRVDLKLAFGSQAPSDGPFTIPRNATGTVHWDLRGVSGCVVTYDGGSGFPVPPSQYSGSRPISDFTSAMTPGQHRFDVNCAASAVGGGGSLHDRVVVTMTDTVTESPTCTGPATTTVNTAVTFNAQRGNGMYTWSSSQGTGSGSSYTVSFPNPGQKTITVNSAGLQGTCNVTVLDGTGNSLVCQGPATAYVDQDVTFGASGGSGTYSWTGGGTPPTAGNVSSFTTKWGIQGTKTVSVTRGSATSVCSIVINTPTSTQGCTVNVSSNAPATWNIAGPTPDGNFLKSPNYPNPVVGANYTTDGSGNRLPAGVYSIVPDSPVGNWQNPTTTPADSQFCADGATINFGLTYEPRPDPPLVCAPPDQYVQSGSPANFTVSGGSGTYSWTGGGTPAVGSGSSFSTSFLGTGQRTVTVSDGAATSTCRATIFPPCTTQCHGPTHLNTNQDGTFYGSSSCGGSYIWTASTQGWGNAVPNYGTGPVFTTRFTDPRGGAKVVTVSNGGQTGTCLVNVSNTSHKECRFNACAVVPGAGPDRCNAAADCGGGTPPPQFHGVCDSGQRACVNRVGSGGGTCADDPACAGATSSHLECQNNSCVIVGGAGADSCTEVGQSCTGGPTGGGGTCTFLANPKVISRGDTSQLAWSCDAGISSCAITNLRTGGSEGSGGGSGNLPVTPTSTTPYQLSCDGGAFIASTTVRVLSIIEVPPR